MRDEYEFSKGKRAKDVPHLAKLQEESKGKTRITIMLDDAVLNNFRSKAIQEGLAYQTLINQVLKSYTESALLDEALLRRVIREELKNEKR